MPRKRLLLILALLFVVLPVAFILSGRLANVSRTGTSIESQNGELRRSLTVAPPRAEGETLTAELYPAWWGNPPKGAEPKPCEDAGKCIDCHKAQATMDPAHAFSCVKCHRGDPEAEEKAAAHRGLIKDPGDLRSAGVTCGGCHADEVRRVSRSAMALAPRMINHTRFAFGAQKSASSEYAVAGTAGLKKVPHPSVSGNLADDLLRRSCLRCHLFTRGSTRWGEHRGLGCAACHTAYPNSLDGAARPHAIVRNVGMTACLKCHNSNHVGADYVGLFEKDFNRGFRSPFLAGKQPPRIYGSEQHRLAADIHFQAGMDCMDCHTLDEIHGSGELPSSSVNGVRISCEGCHVRGDHPAVAKEPEGEWVLRTNVRRKIPIWKPDAIPHSIPEHGKSLRCSACHAAWSFQDYGFHLILEEWADYWKWAPNAAQNDPQVQELLLRYVGTYAELLPPPDGKAPPKPMNQWEPPQTKDWLSGEVRSGAWFRGYTSRRWERPPLGRDSRGKASVMRPIHQYVISHADSEGRLLLDRHIPKTGSGDPALIVNPYAPHTISKTGRQCHECHGNPKAVGLGEGYVGLAKPGFYPIRQPEAKIPGFKFRWDALVDAEGNAVQFSSHPSAGSLDAATVKRLMNPSRLHRAYWARYLKGEPADP